jgi:hypothetical protein
LGLFSPSTEFDIIFVGGFWAMWQHSERYEISQRLWHELDKARLEHAAAAERFNLLVKNPGGIPQPDGSLGIRQAGEASRRALLHYMSALKRFTDFTLDGTVPEDISASGATAPLPDPVKTSQPR